MIFVVAGVEFGRLAGIVSCRADEVGSVTEGLRGGGIATAGLDVTPAPLVTVMLGVGSARRLCCVSLQMPPSKRSEGFRGDRRAASFSCSVTTAVSRKRGAGLRAGVSRSGCHENLGKPFS